MKLTLYYAGLCECHIVDLKRVVCACVWSNLVLILTIIFFFFLNNIGFQMCPQIKAKNYDKVEKVSICYRMEATF